MTPGELISTAVGPAPWYWSTFPTLRDGDRTLLWQYPTEGPYAHLPDLVEEGADQPPLAAGMYARAFAANPGYVGFWYPTKHDGALEVLLFSLRDLCPLPPSAQGSQGVILHASPVAGILNLLDRLPSGRHAGSKARFAGVVHEVLLIADGPPHDTAAASVYVWHPASGEIEVLPQRWFTAEAYDLGYQWITRVIRDPESKRLFGGGIRLPDFELTDSGTEILRFLSR